MKRHSRVRSRPTPPSYSATAVWEPRGNLCVIGGSAALVFLCPLIAGSVLWASAGFIASGFLLLAAWWLLRRHASAFSVSPVPALTALLLFACIQSLSLIRSIDRDLTLKALLLTLAAAAAIFLCSANEPRQPARVAWHIVAPPAALVCALVWESVTGIQEYLLNFRADPSNRIFATFFNPDIAAGFLAMTIPVALAFLWLDLPLVPSFVTSLAAFLGVIALALTASKGGWLALAAGIIVMSIVRSIRPGVRSVSAARRFWMTAGLSALAGIACSRMLFVRIAESGTSQANSAQFRRLVWESALRMIAHRPLDGFGAGAFSQAYPRFAIAGPTQMAHNAYLQAGAESGVLGLILLLAAAAAAILPALARQPRVNGDSPSGSENTPWRASVVGSALVPGLAGGLAASAIHSLLDFDWNMPGLWLQFWAMAGMLAAALSASSGRKMSWDVPRSVRLAAGVIAFIAGIAAGVVAVAAGYSEAARPALGQGQPPPPADEIDPDRGLSLASTALSLNPLDGSLWMLHAAGLRLTARGAMDAESARQHLEQAAGDLERAAQLMPFSAAPLYPLGEVRREQGDLQGASTAFREAIKRDAHALGAGISLADMALLLHHPDEARTALEHVASIEGTPFDRVRGIPEAFDTHYPVAWAGLAALDSQAARWIPAAKEANHALDDLDRYAVLAQQFGKGGGVFQAYQPDSLQQMLGVYTKTTAILEEALRKTNQPEPIPTIEDREAAFRSVMEKLGVGSDATPDPSGSGRVD